MPQPLTSVNEIKSNFVLKKTLEDALLAIHNLKLNPKDMIDEMENGNL